MGKFRDKVTRFLYGRNGPDNLYRALTIPIVVLLILQFAMSFVSPIAYYAIFVLTVSLIAYSIFRMFSKNISKRQAENRKYLELKARFLRFYKMNVNRIRDRKTKAYRRCPNCKTMLKLPRVNGEHTVKCPQCNQKFKVKI